MPGPTSSNDLILEMMREVIAERQRDLGDGITPRSLDKRLNEHAAQDEKRHDTIEDRLRELEQHQARSEAHVETTARYVIPPTPAVGFPPTTINVGNGRSSRPSIVKGIREAAKNPAVNWAAMVILVALSHLLARCGLPVITH